MRLLDATGGTRRRWERCLAAVALTAALGGGLAACGGSDDNGSGVPDGAVAVVGEDQITEDELEDRVEGLRRVQTKAAQSAAKAGGASQQQPPPASGKTVRRQALATLLQSAALEQEAKERGIEVSDAEVEERWKAAAGNQFRTKRALKRFLRGQTEQDILDQLRVQILSEQIIANVSEEAGGGKDSAKAVEQFQKEFQERWRDKTACKDAKQFAGMCSSDG